MANNERLCIDCTIPMKKKFVVYKGVKLEARECPKCQERIFTEDLAMKAISTLEAKRMAVEYSKHPIKVGNSWGMTFPKEVVEVFGIGDATKTLKIHPLAQKGKIEISVE